ncbi:MAG TPA: hypothetical protein VFL34_05285 [Candidatus Sulfotelmatobacter sp.]|nr:hypothetical protein [Candidatus Sulfotelmatobacter sp.]
MSCLLAGAVVLASSTRSSAQAQHPASALASPTVSEDDASPAQAARDKKARNTTRAKRIVTDEDMAIKAGPLPGLKMDGAENGDEVVAAINAFRITHTPEQTESAVRIWYDRYDEMLAAAIRQNLDTKSLRETNYRNGYELCQESQDSEQCHARQMAELRGARIDQMEMTKNSNLEVRIQHAFLKVRNGLAKNGVRYDWFRVRTTNGIDVF